MSNLFVSGVSAVQPSIAASSALTGTVPVGNGGTGLTSVALNRQPIGNAAGAYVTAIPDTQLIAYATALSVTASGDQLLTMVNNANLGNYIVRRVTCALPLSTSLASSVVIAVLRTASGGGGAALTGNLVFTGLTTTTFLDQAVLLASGVSTATQLFVQTLTAAVASNSQLFVYADVIGV